MIAFGAEPMELMLDRPARTDHAAVELAYATDNLPLVRDMLQSFGSWPRRERPVKVVLGPVFS